MRQSIRRLTKDLQIDGTNSREWRILPNPSGTTGVSDIRAGIQEWLTPGLPPSRKRTALIVVMKNKKRLENLADIIETLGDELQGVPTLIVDDEADQAGLAAHILRHSIKNPLRLHLRGFLVVRRGMKATNSDN